MATKRDTTILAGALVTLSAATSFGLTRVFAHAGWLALLITTALIATATVLITKALDWATQLRIVLLGIVLMWWGAAVTRPRETWLGIPTFNGIRHFFGALSSAGQLLRTAIVPVSPTGPALQLAILVTFITAAGSAWSATKPDGTLQALVAQLALFIAVSALGKRSYIASVTVWIAAAFAFMLVHHTLTTAAARAEFQASRPRQSRLVAGGIIGATIAIAIAAIAGPQLPGASSAALIHYRHSNGHHGPGTITAISPLIKIRDQLNQRDNSELFVVRADQPARWRLVGLESFKNDQWDIDANTTAGQDLQNSGAEPNAIIVRLDQEYAIGPMSGKFIPAAYQARSVVGLRDRFIIRDSATLLVDDKNHSGLRYQITSDLTGADASTLRAAPAPDLNNAVLQRNVRLPNNISTRITDLARQIAAGKSTQYDKVLALQQYLRTFQYDTTVDLSESNNAMVDFLFKVKRGFCEQFAGTFGVMARSLGIPTRIAVGFQPGERKVDGYHVTVRQAHAWPEVYFSGVGWIAFEPTPSIFDRESPGDPNGTHKAAPPVSDNGGPFKPTTSTKPKPVASSTNAPATPTTTALPNQPVRPATPQAQDAGLSTPARVGLGLGSVAAIGAAPLGCWRLLRWRRRRRRELRGSTRDRVTNAWAHAMECLALFDIRRRPSTTAVEFALREAPAAGVGDAGGPLLELSQLHTTAMYSGEEPDDADAHNAWECVERIEAALRESLKRKRRAWLIRLRW